jgi:hypothetical protein
MKYRYLLSSGLLAAVYLLSSDSADAAWLSNPHVVVTGNCASEVVLSMDLDAYGNYGAADGRADVLYSGEGGSWTFGNPCPDTNQVLLLVVVSLDDHYDVPLGNYELEVVVNGETVASGYADDLELRHGTPFGAQFDNWSYLLMAVDPAEQYDVRVYNRSGLPSTDWIAIDRISMHLRK